ncbi:MAG: recombinase [Desulfobulbaceae bacterium]|jgi:hypothetical protein
MDEPKERRWTKEEIQERKINMVKERGARVLKINSPLGSTLFNILRQFDMAYAHFKSRLGEMGGISYKDGEALMEEGREIVMAFSDFTDRLSRQINFRYFTPREISEFLKALNVPENEAPCVIDSILVSEREKLAQAEKTKDKEKNG